MKIKTWITVEQEVEVEVTTEDVCRALNGEAECLSEVFVGLNNMSQFMEAVTEEIIEQMTPGQRVCVAGFFKKQMVRFVEKGGDV